MHLLYVTLDKSVWKINIM
uniref:Uncharacterized protein n=1 Tax=Anguilla anguilla TaxID=7936 RepID=A0A0E9PTU7_ANGAN